MDDGLTNSAGYVIRLVQLNQPNKPSGIIRAVQIKDEHIVVSVIRRDKKID